MPPIDLTKASLRTSGPWSGWAAAQMPTRHVRQSQTVGSPSGGAGSLPASRGTRWRGVLGQVMAGVGMAGEEDIFHSSSRCARVSLSSRYRMVTSMRGGRELVVMGWKNVKAASASSWGSGKRGSDSRGGERVGAAPTLGSRWRK